MRLKLAGNNKSSLAIPQKVKAQSKSRGALNASTGNIQPSNALTAKQSPTLLREQGTKESQTQPHPIYSNDLTTKQRLGNKKQIELNSKLSQRQ